jgi:putative peptidoglycan lipid II flippase
MGAAAAVVAGSVLLSRILGLGREALIAGLIGVNAETDLYRFAFSIPDFLNYLLAGAYLTITLVPILSRHLEQADEERMNRAFSSVFKFVSLAIVGLTAALWLSAGPLIDLVFPEVDDPARLVTLTRIVLPAQIFLVIGALLMAYQYTQRRFLSPAMAPIVYNLGIIGGGLIGAAVGDPSPEYFLWGAVAGSALGNFGLQWIGARRLGMRIVPVPRGESSIGEYLLLALPLMLGQSIAVLDEQFINWFGQVEEGAAAALNFARRLNMVPIGVIAQAAGVAAFPFLARLAARGDEGELVETTGRAARNTIFAAAAATAALVVIAKPMVRLVYQYGEFTASDTELVTSLLVIYALSIPAWGLHQILARHFYAKRKMWTPVAIGTAGAIVAVPLWLGLYDALGIEGFALASTLIMTAYSLGLLVAWGRDSGWAAVRRLAPSFGRGLAAAAAAAAITIPLLDLVFSGSEGIGQRLAEAVVGGVGALVVFAGASRLMRSPELADIMNRRQRGSSAV